MLDIDAVLIIVKSIMILVFLTNTLIAARDGSGFIPDYGFWGVINLIGTIAVIFILGKSVVEYAILIWRLCTQK